MESPHRFYQRAQLIQTSQVFARLRRALAPRAVELAPREAYRLWADSYPPYAHNLLMRVEERAVLAQLPNVRADRVLDLACGSGRYARILCERGAIVLGLDLSFEMLARAENSFPRAQADLLALPLADSSADCIVCGLAVGHVSDLPRALAEMARALRPGGTLIYSDFYAEGAARGWQRTFRANDRTYAVQTHPRAVAEHRAACAAAGLLVETIETPTVPADLTQSDPQAAAFRAEWGDTPLALILRAVKPS